MKTKPGLLVLGALVGAIFSTSGSAYAVSGNCYFGSGTCSAPGFGNYGTNDVFTGRDSNGNGSAIPSSVNNKSEFVNYIKNRFNGGKHDKTGASFVIQELRGSTSRATNADLNDWVERMSNPDIRVYRDGSHIVHRTSWYDPANNDTFYDDYTAIRAVIVIEYKGKVHARIEYNCGNLVAGVIKIPPANWRVSLDSKVSPTNTVHVGRVATWRHYMTNEGPDATSLDIDWDIQSRGSSDMGEEKGVWRSGKDKDDVLTRRSTYTTKVDDIGKTLCQRIVANPYRDEGGTDASQWACTRVISEFSLTPSILVDGSNSQAVVVPGSVPHIAGNVHKADDITPPVAWELSKIVVAPGGSIPSIQTDNNTTPRNHFGNAFTTLRSGSQSFALVNTPIPPTGIDSEIDELVAGTRVCWALSVKPRSNTADEWRHSAPVCVKIGKKPKFQILGGDVRVRGDVGASTTTLNRGGSLRTFGSWVEFGVFSIDTNTFFASGAGLRSGSPSSQQDDWSKLTFANVNSLDSPAFGKFTGLPAAPEVAEYFEGRVKAGVTLSDLTAATPSNVYETTGDLTIDTTDLVIPKGRSIIIVARGGTVTITSNISYENAAMSSLGDIPQLVIVAAKIVIDPAVTNVDAWLLASESINTCGSVANLSVPPALTVSSCNNPLTINGPVAAGKLYLYRTAGSGTGADAEAPAEKFNFRPDATLWAYNYGLALGQPVTSSAVGLPPRF